jgi:energy-converting hydrogenase Eha subunit B
MLTDGTTERWDGVSDVADEVAERGGSLVGTLFLGLIVFAVGAACGFVARLFWPNTHGSRP